MPLLFITKRKKLRPNQMTTFVSLLTACTHAGLVELGFGFFKTMRSVHNIIPKVEHCACIVDPFCRSGRLQEAYEFVCRLFSCVELAKQAVEKLFILESENSSNYVSTSSFLTYKLVWGDGKKP
ncbi:hypothetical protein NE237_018690 [Protea cynaroides]|uniref:Pentatricopeptide repeat-containing protein n=1 Tax=Protea cynaroides TaxID=273540 RepID=A0A9Q0KAK2_9MAGN|nr:hypothetical protein NE237_018690 [Protea cynaroides]